MSRQAGGRAGGATGGVGLRGPGETKLETDRRRIHKRISKLRKEISAMGVVRETKRGRRVANDVPNVAIVGYTNAGKSSLLNAITHAGVLVEDALFATLDPTTRRSQTPDGLSYTLTDTVGFVRHLPHQIVEAFRSTLEEAADADLLLHVVDGSDPRPEWQVNAVREVLGEIGGKLNRSMPAELVVVNKTDAADEVALARLRNLLPGAVFVSARTGDGVAALREEIAGRIPAPNMVVEVLVPYTRGELVARMHEQGEVLAEDHTPEGTVLKARVRADLAGALEAYAVNGSPA
jgi:GTP-binding protein HflX